MSFHAKPFPKILIQPLRFEFQNEINNLPKKLIWK